MCERLNPLYTIFFFSTLDPTDTYESIVGKKNV